MQSEILALFCKRSNERKNRRKHTKSRRTGEHTAPPRLDPATPSTTDEEQTNRRTQRQRPGDLLKASNQQNEQEREKHLDNISTTRAAAPPRHPLKSHKHTATTPPTKSNTTPPRLLPSSSKSPIICNSSSFFPFPLITPFYNAILHRNAASTIMQAPPRSRSTAHDQQSAPFPLEPPIHFSSIPVSIRNRHGLTTPANYPSAVQPRKAKRPTWQTSRAHHNPVTRPQLSLLYKGTERGQRHHAITILQTIPATIIIIYNYHYSYYVTTL